MEVDEFKENFDFSFYKPNSRVFGVNSAGKSTFLNTLWGSSFAEELRDEFFSNVLNSFEKANNALMR